MVQTHSAAPLLHQDAMLSGVKRREDGLQSAVGEELESEFDELFGCESVDG